MMKHRARSIRFVLVIYLMIVYTIPHGVAQTEGDSIWHRVDVAYPMAQFSDIAFANATHGWLVGRTEDGLGNGIILATCDGGLTWEEQYYNSSQWFRQIEVVDENTVWVAGLGSLVYTHDGGATWYTVHFLDHSSLFGVIEFKNSTHGWASTNKILFFTNDSGELWYECDSWTFDDTGRNAVVSSPNTIDIIGFDGIYHSGDGGSSWSQTYSVGGWAISFGAHPHGWGVADSHLFSTEDGVTWIENPIPDSAPFQGFRGPYLTDVQFLDALHGWVVAGDIPVRYTPDGGQNWYSQDVDQSVGRLMTVEFLNLTHGWAAGSGGAVLITTKGDGLGLRLWLGPTDPVFVTLVIVSSGITLAVIALYIWRKRTGSLSR